MIIKTRKDYIVDMPKKKILIGDPLYFEDYADDTKKLNSLISHLKITKALKEKMKCFISVIEGEEDRYNFVELRICLSPEENAHVYMQDRKYTSQKVKTKDIGVDSATYLFEVDDNSYEFNTDADGYWGCEQTFYRTINGKKNVDAYLITLTIPDDISAKETIEYMDCFFKNRRDYKLKEITN